MNFRNKNMTRDMGFQIAPMIDIAFILLCFFVVSQIFAQWETEIDVKLPTAETGKIPRRLPGEIVINILQDGSTIITGQKISEPRLISVLNRIVKMFPGQPVLIRADKRTAYEHVIRVLDLCRQADIWNIAFATSGSEQTTN